jgi:hypothetical protein
VPDVLAHHHAPPSWSAWTSHLLEHVTRGHEPIVVGHSSASALVADLATKLPARGIIIVDGDVPPSRGAAVPVRPALHDFIKGLVEPDGMLPIWSRWFARDTRRMSLVGLDILARDAVAFARFESGLPRMHVGWFDDAIELANWEHIPAGFIQTSAIYDHAAIEAERRGWPVTNLHGTHLHPTLHPAETANAILSMSHQLVSGGKQIGDDAETARTETAVSAAGPVSNPGVANVPRECAPIAMRSVEVAIEKPVQAATCIVRRLAIVLQPVIKQGRAGLEVRVIESMVRAGIDNELDWRPVVAPAGDFIGAVCRRRPIVEGPNEIGMPGRPTACLQGG